MNTKQNLAPVSSFLKLVAVSSACMLGGCAANVEGDDLATLEAAPEEAVGATSHAVGIANPTGAYFAEINANGTGCPAGSWTADISPDGQTFTVTFSQYETFVTRGKFIDVKDCQLGIKLRSPQGLSFSIASFDYSGYAALDSDGMRGDQTASYYFQGNRLDSSKGKTTIHGIYEGEYTYRDRVGVTDVVWSPCGVDRQLNIATRLVLKNNASRTGNGYMNATSTDGSIKLVFSFDLAWRPCTL